MVRTRICLMLIHLPRHLKAMSQGRTVRMLMAKMQTVSKARANRDSKDSRGNKVKIKKTAKTARTSAPRQLRS